MTVHQRTTSHAYIVAQYIVWQSSGGGKCPVRPCTPVRLHMLGRSPMMIGEAT